MFDNFFNNNIIAAYQKMHAKKQLIESVIDAPFMEGVDDEETANFMKWKGDVQSAHPGKNLSFKGRVEGQTNTVSAEVPGEDRSYGVWDAEEKKGHVFTESEDSGGDPSAYNKWLLAKLGDLPRTEAGYEKGQMEGCSDEKKMDEGVTDIQFMGKVSKDGNPFSLWRKGNYHYELTHSTGSGEAYKSVADWADKSHEDVMKYLEAQGYSKVEEELKGDQVKLDKNHNGEIDSQDLAIVRKEKVTEEDHSDEKEDKELIRDMVKPEALKEYHVAGTVNDKPFKMVTDDVYNYKDAKEQNPHLSDDEAKAVVDHTETDDFMNGDEDTESVQNGHTVKTHTNGGYAGERDEVRGKLGLQEDSTDTVSMDVPFLIRVMEFAREDAKTDQDLHVATEKMVELSKNGPLTMAAYDEVFGKKHSGPDGDNDADDQGVKEEKLEEVLTADTPIETWIKDFQDSDNPKFEGKSKEERRKMAIGAYYGAQKA